MITSISQLFWKTSADLALFVMLICLICRLLYCHSKHKGLWHFVQSRLPLIACGYKTVDCMCDDSDCVLGQWDNIDSKAEWCRTVLPLLGIKNPDCSGSEKIVFSCILSLSPGTFKSSCYGPKVLEVVASASLPLVQSHHWPVCVRLFRHFYWLLAGKSFNISVGLRFSTEGIMPWSERHLCQRSILGWEVLQNAPCIRC